MEPIYDLRVLGDSNKTKVYINRADKFQKESLQAISLFVWTSSGFLLSDAFTTAFNAKSLFN